MMMGNSHGVSKLGFNIVILSTTKESQTFDEDFKIGFEIIGPIKYRFDVEQQMYQGGSDNKGMYITNTLDETSHFESAIQDVERIYKQITGKQLDLDLPEKIQVQV
jgi:Rab GDP dissociation inhibitor